MKIKSIMKNGHYRLSWMVIMLIAFCLVGCSDSDKEENNVPYDPSQPVEITGFTPEKGGRGQRMVIYGKNFGNDPGIINVLIGGKKALVIGAKSESIYCIVPPKAYKGTVEVEVGANENPGKATTEKKFNYLQQMLVSTLFGYKTDRDDQGYKMGKFYNPDGTPLAAGFKHDSYIKFDPIEKHHLYIGFQGNQLYRVDLKDSTFTRVSDGWETLRCLDFSPDGKYLFTAEERDQEAGRAVRVLKRGDKFVAKQVFTNYKKCTTVAVHPINGELYFNSSEKSQFYQIDYDKMQEFYANNTKTPGTYRNELFKIQDNDWVYRILIHPTGEYAYIMVVNKGCIMRVDYDDDLKRFNQPYIICGEAGKTADHTDGIGVSARLRRPWQGVFVKNEDYVAAGRKDIYDLYFTDKDSHSVRILTPNGVVSTFAGRGSPYLNNSASGFVDGEIRNEARFDNPSGIEYDESTKTFYVSDMGNRRLRTIAMEELED